MSASYLPVFLIVLLWIETRAFFFNRHYFQESAGASSFFVLRRPQQHLLYPLSVPSFALRGGADHDDDNHDDNTLISTEEEEEPSFWNPIVETSSSPHLDDSTRQQQQQPLTVSKILICMDCFCSYHGLYLAQQALQKDNVAVVYLLSDYVRNYLVWTNNNDDDDDGSLSEHRGVPRMQRAQTPTTPAQAHAWKQALAEQFGYSSWDKLLSSTTTLHTALYCESDAGLEQAERTRALLGIHPCVDEPIVSLARRQKYQMHQTVQAHGLRVPIQKECTSLQQTQNYVQELWKKGASSAAVVIKPVRGVGTENVFYCTELTQVEKAWDTITQSSVLGEKAQYHTSVLVQEYLEGPEYAVDVVSANGQHKIAAIWKYEKGAIHPGTAPFCYFQTKLVDEHTDPHCAQIYAYVQDCLNALGIRYGLTHTEVIMVNDQSVKVPVLMEVNCRQHNMDFSPLTMACIGYNALDMTVDALLHNDEFELYPSKPQLRAHGCMIHLVHSKSGILREICNLEEIFQNLGSSTILDYEIYHEIGDYVEATCDIKTDAGWIQLVNEDETALQEDYSRIVKEYMPTMFVVEEVEANEDDRV